VAWSSCLVVGWTVVSLAVGGCGGSKMPRAARPIEAEYKKIRASLQEKSGGEAAAETAAVAEPTGHVTFRGTFKFQGTAPPLSMVGQITADCRGMTESVPIEDLVVDPQTSGIANIVLFAEEVPDAWIPEAARKAAEPEAVFDQAKCNFKTHVLAMHTGQVLRVLNSDPFGHNTKFDPRGNTPMNQLISNSKDGITYQPTKSEKEPFPVSCSIHPWMKAYMLFRDNTYFAVTKPDGTFEIPNLPAGVPLTFRVWQEKSKGLPSASITSPASLAGKPLKKGRFTITLDAANEAANQLDVTVDIASFQ